MVILSPLGRLELFINYFSNGFPELCLSTTFRFGLSPKPDFLRWVTFRHNRTPRLQLQSHLRIGTAILYSHYVGTCKLRDQLQISSEADGGIIFPGQPTSAQILFLLLSHLQNNLFAQTLRYAQNFILGISIICLW